MPRGDRTGPDGAGPRTGRGLGDCLPTSNPKIRRPRIGRSLGIGSRDGRGGGRRWRLW